MKFAIIVGNRGFFPDHLAKTGRLEMLADSDPRVAREIRAMAFDALARLQNQILILRDGRFAWVQSTTEMGILG